MARRLGRLADSPAMAVAFTLLAALPVVAQAPRAAKVDATQHAEFRTPWGDPDLQGIWSGSTLTPLERPQNLGDKQLLTKEEVAKLEKQATESRAVDRPPTEGDPGTYNQLWFEPALRALPGGRTSLIVDPPDGRIPFTPEGREAQAHARARYGKGTYNSWLDLDSGERCITDGPPVYMGGYNNNYQIVQAPGYVAILHELYREPRIIRLNAGPAGSIPEPMGNPRGHWEGDTLVVESANFPDRPDWNWQDAWRSVRPSTHLVERFRRVDAKTIDYQFTWEDPTMFARPWTAAYPLTTDSISPDVTVQGIFEYACHEANYGLVDILSGARQREKAAAAGSSR